MKCSDVDRILPDIIDGIPISGDQDLEFQSHLRTCQHCSELVSDLKLIASEARQLSNTEEPAPRVWVRIAAELRAEGLIREPEKEPGLAPVRPVLVPAAQRRWSAFWLAPVAVAILAAGSYLLTHKATPPVTPQVAKQSGAQQPGTQAAQQPAAQQVAQQPAATPAAQIPTRQAPQVPPEQARVSPPPSADDQQFLSEVSSRAPTMRTNYENQLQAVDNEIRETQAYIDQHPGDVDARQHLLEVYQQKAMLYQMALERIQ